MPTEFGIVILVGSELWGQDDHDPYVRMLRSQGHLVLHAREAQDALGHAARIIPSVIVVDAGLYDAASLCRHFKRLQISLIVCVPEGRKRPTWATGKHCDSVITGPTSPAALAERVAETLQQTRKAPARRRRA